MSNTPWLYEQHDGCLIRNMNCLPFANTSVHPELLVGPVSPRVIGGARVIQSYWFCPCHPGLLLGPVSPRAIHGVRVTQGNWWGPCHPGLLVGPMSPRVIGGALSPRVIGGARVTHGYCWGPYCSSSFLFCVLSLHGLYSTNYALEPWINLIIQMHGITATIFLPSFWTKPGKYIYDRGIDLPCFYDFPIGFWNCSDSVVFLTSKEGSSTSSVGIGVWIGWTRGTSSYRHWNKHNNSFS